MRKPLNADRLRHLTISDEYPNRVLRISLRRRGKPMVGNVVACNYFIPPFKEFERGDFYFAVRLIELGHRGRQKLSKTASFEAGI